MKNHEKEDYNCKTLTVYAPECSFQAKKLASFYKTKEQFSSASVDYLEEISGKPKKTKLLDAEGKKSIKWEWEELPRWITTWFWKNWFKWLVYVYQNRKRCSNMKPICQSSSPPLVHQDLEHEKIETSDLSTQNLNSNDIPIINKLMSPIVAYSN